MLRLRTVVALVASAGSLVAAGGCSSGTSAPDRRPAASHRPETSPSYSFDTSSAVIEHVPSAASTDKAAADRWLNTSPHRLDLELMLATAADLKREQGRDSSTCLQLVTAAFKLDDELPRYRHAGNDDPMIQGIITATSKYTIAGNACGIGFPNGAVHTVHLGDLGIKKAEAVAKSRHLHL